MRGEIQNSMQSRRVPVVKLQRVEEIYPYVLGEGSVSALCRENNFIILIPRIYVAKEIKIFLGSLGCLFHLPLSQLLKIYFHIPML
jgi:hypothetical protein